MGKRLKAAHYLGALLLLVLVLRLVSLGGYPLMDTTEARYAEISRKILETGDWITPWFDYGVPFWGKPPLAFWASAATMSLFGVGEFGARLAPYLASLLTCLLFFAWPFREARTCKALGACVVLQTAAVGFVSSGAVMTDAFLLLGIALSMVSFWNVMDGESANRAGVPWGSWKYLFWVGLAVGLLSKGPLALVLVGMPIALWLSWQRRCRAAWRRLPLLSGIALMLLLSLPWYLAAESATPGFLRYFIVGEHIERFLIRDWSGDLYGAGHGRPRGTIWLYALQCLLPWILLVPLFVRRGLGRFARGECGKKAYLLLWGLCPLLFFTLARNILPAYVLPSLFPFAIAVSEAMANLEARAAGNRYLWLAPVVLVALVVCSLPFAPVQQIFRDKTQKALIAAWDPASPLVYLGRRPYSAQFYARGRVALVPQADIERYAASDEPARSGATLVAQTGHYDRYLKKDDRWRVKAQNGKWVMLVAKPRALAAAER